MGYIQLTELWAVRELLSGQPRSQVLSSTGLSQGRVGENPGNEVAIWRVGQVIPRIVSFPRFCPPTWACFFFLRSNHKVEKHGIKPN